MSEPESGPIPRLDYAKPEPPARSVIRGLASAFVATVAFAVGHWATEYATDYLLVWKWGIGVEPHQSSRKQFIWGMVIETFYTLSASVFVAAVQLAADYFLQRRTSASPRRHAWALALILGALFCWTRWGIDLLYPRHLFFQELIDWLIAMALAAGIGFIISRWRWPRRSSHLTRVRMQTQSPLLNSVANPREESGRLT